MPAASAAATRCSASRTRRCSPAPAGSPTTCGSTERPTSRSCARRMRMPASSRSTPTRRARCPACWRSTPAPSWPAAGVKPIPSIDVFKRADGKVLVTPARRALAHERVRFVGEAVAAVVAETREAARDACEALMVDFDELPAVVDTVAATQPGAAVIHPDAPDNIAAELRHGNAAATATAFAGAAHVVALDLLNQRVAPSSIEPRSVLAEFDPASGRLTMRLSSQMPTGVMTSLQDLLPGFEKGQVRVVVGDVGGGFGMKTGIYPEDMVVGWAARALQRPVRWQAERSEDLVSAVHGRDVVSKAELALDANGKVLALRVRSLANVGAYATATGVVIQLMIGPWVSTSIYDIQTVDLHFLAVLTNEAPTGAYRGAGRPEAIYLIERLFDAAAREMKLDPAELRRRNMIRPEQMPYTNPLQQVYDSGRFEQVLDQGLALADWNGFAARARRVETARQAARPRHRDLPRMDRRQRVRGARRRRRLGRRLHRDLLGDPGDGAGHRDQLCAARGRRVRRADREDPHPAGRHRPRPGLRQRRLALALHRRQFGPRRGREDRHAGEGPGGRGARGGAGRHRIPRRPAPGRRHRPRHRPVRAGSEAARGADPHRFDQHGRRPDLAERLPRLRGRDRSGDRPRRGRRLRVGQRHRQGRQPDDRARPGRRRRGPGHRPGALRAGRLRPRQRPDADRHA